MSAKHEIHLDSENNCSPNFVDANLSGFCWILGGILQLMVYSQQVRPACPEGDWCQATGWATPRLGNFWRKFHHFNWASLLSVDLLIVYSNSWSDFVSICSKHIHVYIYIYIIYALHTYIFESLFFLSHLWFRSHLQLIDGSGVFLFRASNSTLL